MWGKLPFILFWGSGGGGAAVEKSEAHRILRIPAAAKDKMLSHLSGKKGATRRGNRGRAAGSGCRGCVRQNIISSAESGNKEFGGAL